MRSPTTARISHDLDPFCFSLSISPVGCFSLHASYNVTPMSYKVDKARLRSSNASMFVPSTRKSQGDLRSSTLLRSWRAGLRGLRCGKRQVMLAPFSGKAVVTGNLIQGPLIMLNLGAKKAVIENNVSD